MPQKRNHELLKITFHGRIIDHLGLQMYQKPVAALAEMVSNAWDADAENVFISLPANLEKKSVIEVRDDGEGMTFEDCEERYLKVGWCRREIQNGNRTRTRKRKVLGRKGIGKFAGFGIAEIIRIETISGRTGEKTVFELNIEELRSDQYVVEGGEVKVVQYLPPDKSRIAQKGTAVILKRLILGKAPAPSIYARSMARRFLLRQLTDDFKILLNGTELPESFELARAQYLFPRDYKEGEEPPGLLRVDEESGWGEEEIETDTTIKWRVLFHDNPISEEDELAGVAIFCRGKMAQEPFFFNLTGGLGGQHGQAYITGQVEADYLDELEKDTVTTDRQGITWENPRASTLERWGQKRVKELLRIWRDRRGEKRRQALDLRLAGFSNRLGKLEPTEQKTVDRALRVIARMPQINEQEFDLVGDAILTSWEQGRLRTLIAEVADSEALSHEEFFRLMKEAEVLSALNVAEAVKTKLLAVGGLKSKIDNKELENAVRDYIAENPWLISPQLDHYKKEITTRKLLISAAKSAKLGVNGNEQRVDLALSGGRDLVIIEFMQPGKALDWDHLGRFEHYVRIIRANVEANTAGNFDNVTGYVVADSLEKEPAILAKIREMGRDRMYAMDWDTLFQKALSGWREFLEILVTRAPKDDRLSSLL